MARSFYQLGLCVSLATLAAACGDDGSTSGGGGGNGGEGGGRTTTSSTSTTTGNTTTSEGGGGSGGATTTSTEGGGGTGGSTTTSAGGGGSGGGGNGGGGNGGTGGGTGGTGGGTGGAGGGTGGAGGMMGPTPSEQIGAVKAAADGVVDLPVAGVFVTYLKPELGMDVAGFFVQAEAAGPAIFVAVDPASLTPAPQIGDEIEFTATEVTTNAGVKQVTQIANAALVSTGNAIDPLVTDVSMASDLVTNLDMYESRAIKITGNLTADFINAGFPQQATPIATMGLADPDLRLRMPNTIRDQYDLENTCNVTVDYGVMWRFNAVAQPSVYAAGDLMNMTCPQPTVAGAIPTSLTELVVTFSRNIDPASVDATDFMFDNGLTAAAVAVTGDTVTITTSPQVPGTAYTLTAMNVNDVLGAPLGMPNTAMFNAYVPVAQMVFNEINANITQNGRDLVELLVTAPGTTNGITLVQNGSNVELIATFPDVLVQTGELIVVHVQPASAAGTANASETLAKNEFPAATNAANYDGAWDFLGTNTGLTFSNRVLELDGPGGVHIDAVPVVLSSSANPPAAFPGDLQALQAEGNWLPVDCGGMMCTYASTPTAVAVSVDYLGCGNSPTGNSISRKPGMITKMNSDWNAAGAQSWGLPNP